MRKLEVWLGQIFPLMLCYGITVHKSQGLTISTGCVFNMQHEPTWSPLKNMCGLAFVGFSRVTDFAKMAFKYVPDYWAFQAMAESDLFRWRSTLEERLDKLHDLTANEIFDGKATLEDDVARHRSWTEKQKGRAMSEAEIADLKHMLSVRGVLPQPQYTDKTCSAQRKQSRRWQKPTENYAWHWCACWNRSCGIRSKGAEWARVRRGKNASRFRSEKNRGRKRLDRSNVFRRWRCNL